MSEEYVATDTDDTYFLGSIFCESPVDSGNDNSRAQMKPNGISTSMLTVTPLISR